MKLYVKFRKLDFVFWPIIPYEKNLAYSSFADLKKIKVSLLHDETNEIKNINFVECNPYLTK